MKNRILTLVIIFLLIISTIPCVYAAEIIDSGDCGSDTLWKLYKDGTLIISGTGNIKDNAFSKDLRIKKIIIEEGITNILLF